jgi:hypothetical protein
MEEPNPDCPECKGTGRNKIIVRNNYVLCAVPPDYEMQPGDYEGIPNSTRCFTCYPAGRRIKRLLGEEP